MQTSCLQECAFIVSRKAFASVAQLGDSLKLGLWKYDDQITYIYKWYRYVYKYSLKESSLSSGILGGGWEGTEEQKKAQKIWIKIWNVFLFHYFLTSEVQ